MRFTEVFEQAIKKCGSTGACIRCDIECNFGTPEDLADFAAKLLKWLEDRPDNGYISVFREVVENEITENGAAGVVEMMAAVFTADVIATKRGLDMFDQVMFALQPHPLAILQALQARQA